MENDQTKFKILIVDDEPAVLDSYSSILESSSNLDELSQKGTELFGKGDAQDELSEMEPDLEEKYDITYLQQGNDAVQAVRESLDNKDPFSLIFLDIRMPPGIDGRETAKQIRQLDPLIEIVIMTAYSDYSFMDIVQEVGKSERILFFKKPFAATQIRQLACSLTQKWDVDSAPLRKMQSLQPGEFPEEGSIDEQIEWWQKFLQQTDIYWKHKIDSIYGDDQFPKTFQKLQINYLRKTIRHYMIPWLDKVQTMKTEKKTKYMLNMYVFRSIETFYQMINHFYGVTFIKDDQWEIAERDQYNQEQLVLFDLFKIQKNVEICDVLEQSLHSKEFEPTNDYSTDPESIVINARRAFWMTYKQCIEKEHLALIASRISPDMFSRQAIENRRSQRIQYCHPQTVNGDRYSRIFQQILFRETIKTTVKGKEIGFQYDLVQFEVLKREFLSSWLVKLKDHPEKQKLYKKIRLRGRLLSEWVLEDITGEAKVLDELPVDHFNNLVAELSSSVPDSDKPAFQPVTEQYGAVRQAREHIEKTDSVLNADGSSPHMEPREFLDELQESSQVSDHWSLPESDKQVESWVSKIQRELKAFDTPLQLDDTWLDMNHILILMTETTKTEIIETLSNQEWGNLIESVEKVSKSQLHEADRILCYECDLKYTGFEHKVLRMERTFELSVGSNKKLPEKMESLSAMWAECELFQTHEQWTAAYRSAGRGRYLKAVYDQLESERAELVAMMKPLTTDYNQLLFALIIAGKYSAGHLKQLCRALIQFDKILFISAAPKELMIDLSRTIGNLTETYLWSPETLIESQQITNTKQFRSNRKVANYSMALWTDWNHSSSESLPVTFFFRHANVMDGTSLYQFNLMEFFHKPAYLNIAKRLIENFNKFPIKEMQPKRLERLRSLMMKYDWLGAKMKVCKKLHEENSARWHGKKIPELNDFKKVQLELILKLVELSRK